MARTAAPACCALRLKLPTPILSHPTHMSTGNGSTGRKPSLRRVSEKKRCIVSKLHLEKGGVGKIKGTEIECTPDTYQCRGDGCEEKLNTLRLAMDCKTASRLTPARPPSLPGWKKPLSLPHTPRTNYFPHVFLRSAGMTETHITTLSSARGDCGTSARLRIKTPFLGNLPVLPPFIHFAEVNVALHWGAVA